MIIVIVIMIMILMILIITITTATATTTTTTTTTTTQQQQQSSNAALRATTHAAPHVSICNHARALRKKVISCEMDWADARGPTYARAKQDELITDQDFCLQVRAHLLFVYFHEMVLPR